MNNIELEEYLEFAKDIANYAGKIMLKYFNQNNGARYKGDKTIVTISDTEINSYLIEKVKEKYPNHSVDGEEEKFGESNYVWICDPVDGTAMYARHIPVAVFSLALVVNGEPKVGVVYDVFTDSLYTAIKGNVAYKNNEKITVNDYEFDYMKSVCNYDLWPFLFGNEQRYDKNINGAIISNGVVHDEVVGVVKEYLESLR